MTLFVIYFTDLFTTETLDTSPPSSSKSTNKFPLGFNHDRGTWYLQKTNTKTRFKTKKRARIPKGELWRQVFSLPSLCWFATTRLAFILPVCSSVVTSPAVSFSKSHPVPPYAFPVYPSLSFPHTLQVQSHRLIPSRRIKVGLQMWYTKM